MVLQETVSVSDFARIKRRKVEESLSSDRRSSPTPPVAHTYQPHIPYPQKVAWAKLFKLELRFVQFLDILRKVYANIHFLKPVKKAPTYLKFLRELLSKKGNTGKLQ